MLKEKQSCQLGWEEMPFLKLKIEKRVEKAEGKKKDQPIFRFRVIPFPVVVEKPKAKKFVIDS